MKDLVYSEIKGNIDRETILKPMFPDRTIEKNKYIFNRFSSIQKDILYDVIFKALSVLLLFSIIFGIGLNLTIYNFMSFLKRPGGIVVGLLLQYGVMPLVAVGLGYITHINESYPFIFIGLVLATSSPAGVISNLFTHLTDGELALSISIT